jgi:hypothetical protein
VTVGGPRLAVSSLALKEAVTAGEARQLVNAGVAAVELAPTRLGPWEELSRARIASARREIQDHGLAISSFQSIFFGLQGLELLGGTKPFQLLTDQCERVADLMTEAGALTAVFGAPQQRRRGSIDPEAAFAIGVERFAVLGGIFAARGVQLGLEPVPETYGCDFLTSWQEVLRMVRAVASPGLRCHLDTGCVLLGGGQIAEAIEISAMEVCHFHVAEPKLSGFAQPVADHEGAASALARIGYSATIAIEMLPQGDAPFLALMEAVGYVRQIYFS